MRVTTTALSGARVIQPRVFGDERSYFLETWSRRRYAQHALPTTFVQDDLSR